MNWTVLDAVSAAAPSRPNEDTLGVQGPYAWVIDGAGALGADASLPERPGRRLARDVSLALRTVISGGMDAAPAEVLRAAVEGLRIPPKDAAVLPPSAAAVLLRRDGATMHYAVLADVFVTSPSAELRPITDGRMRAVTREADDAVARELERGAALDEARERVDPLLVKQRQERMNRNVEGAYWVLTRDPTCIEHACVGSEEIVPGVPVLVCSDGFARLAEEAKAYSWNDLVEGVAARGLFPFINELRCLEEQNFLRLSRHDDATGLLLT